MGQTSGKGVEQKGSKQWRPASAPSEQTMLYSAPAARSKQNTRQLF